MSPCFHLCDVPKLSNLIVLVFSTTHTVVSGRFAIEIKMGGEVVKKAKALKNPTRHGKNVP